jgi:hypothetical protein
LTEEQPDEPRDLPAPPPDEPSRTSRDALYEQLGIMLMNAGVVSPASRFITDVRRAAGFRVSPREAVVAVEQMAGARQPITVESVAAMIDTLRGDRSSRQQRHSDAWRTLGAQLALRDLDGSPEGQRAFLGAAHAAAGPRATDALLLQIALTMADKGQRLDPELVGKVGKRLATSAADIDPEQLPPLVERELHSVLRDVRAAERGKKPKRPVTTGSWSQAHNPGARKWRPGGRRRRKIQPAPKSNPDPFERG